MAQLKLSIERERERERRKLANLRNSTKQSINQTNIASLPTVTPLDIGSVEHLVPASKICGDLCGLPPGVSY
jgi:hypothetical protein